MVGYSLLLEVGVWVDLLFFVSVSGVLERGAFYGV